MNWGEFKEISIVSFFAIIFSWTYIHSQYVPWRKRNEKLATYLINCMNVQSVISTTVSFKIIVVLLPSVESNPISCLLKSISVESRDRKLYFAG